MKRRHFTAIMFSAVHLKMIVLNASCSGFSGFLSVSKELQRVVMIYGIILWNLIFLHHHPDELYVEEIWESLAIGCAFISLAIQICSNLLHPSSYLVLLR